MSKRQRLNRLSKRQAKEPVRVAFCLIGEPDITLYKPGDKIIHWTLEDDFTVEIIGESGRSVYHEHKQSQAQAD